MAEESSSPQPSSTVTPAATDAAPATPAVPLNAPLDEPHINAKRYPARAAAAKQVAKFRDPEEKLARLQDEMRLQNAQREAEIQATLAKAQAAIRGDGLTKDQAKDQIRSMIREFLGEKVKRGRGRKQREATRLQFIAETLFTIATDRRSPFAVPAANALLDRGFGKPVAGDLDDPSTKKGGLTVVYVDRARMDESIPLVNADDLQRKQLPAPEFIDAEYEEEPSNVSKR